MERAVWELIETHSALNSPTECQKFMCDFVHLTGNAKPWMTYTPEDVLNSEVKPRTPNELWWHMCI
jgi:hypothetical protein